MQVETPQNENGWKSKKTCFESTYPHPARVYTYDSSMRMVIFLKKWSAQISAGASAYENEVFELSLEYGSLCVS